MVSRSIVFVTAIIALLASVNWWILSHRAGKKVWMTLLTNEKYLVGALTLEYSIRKSGSQYPLVVFHPPTLDEASLQALHKRKISTKATNLLFPTTHKEYGSDERFYDCWSKLLPHGMTDYDRIVELDADMLVRDNCDELMEMSLPTGFMAATHACVCNPRKMSHYPPDWTPENCAYTQQHNEPDTAHLMQHAVHANFGTATLNGGLQVVDPNRKHFDDILDILANATLTDSFAFADQSVLSYYFKDKWISLPYTYNALKTMRSAHAPIWRDEHAKIIHYILNDKPWHDTLEENSDFEPNSWWWKINNERLLDERRSEAREYVTKTLSKQKIVIFSKSYCPHCRAAKQTLDELSIQYSTIELDQMHEGKYMQEYLSTISKVSTVPQIFVRGKFVGGNSNLQQIRSNTGQIAKVFS